MVIQRVVAGIEADWHLHGERGKCLERLIEYIVH